MTHQAGAENAEVDQMKSYYHNNKMLPLTGVHILNLTHDDFAFM